jgi:hypothetical protein
VLSSISDLVVEYTKYLLTGCKFLQSSEVDQRLFSLVLHFPATALQILYPGSQQIPRPWKGLADQRALIQTNILEGGKKEKKQRKVRILERGEHTYAAFDVSRKRKVRL